MISFWPAIEPAQLEYERLRELALTEVLMAGPQAERFRRGGLAALIRRPPTSMPARLTRLVPVARPRWSPYEDPRLTALADAYDLLRSVAFDLESTLEDVQ